MENAEIPLLDIRRRIQNVSSLPVRPEVASELIALRGKGVRDVDQLVSVIEKDPVVAAKIVSWAGSPYYGYRGKVPDVRTAIVRVLGFDRGMHLAIAATFNQRLRYVVRGPLSLDKVWRHAVSNAHLVASLSGNVETLGKSCAGSAYLAGLLHNVGILLLGTLFSREFALLSNIASRKGALPITALEKKIFGITHTIAGKYLMRAWEMPEEVVVAVAEHHNENYFGDHAAYSHLVLVANRLLAAEGIGDEESSVIPTSSMEFLGLSYNNLACAFSDLRRMTDEITSFGQLLAA